MLFFADPALTILQSMMFCRSTRGNSVGHRLGLLSIIDDLLPVDHQVNHALGVLPWLTIRCFVCNTLSIKYNDIGDHCFFESPQSFNPMMSPGGEVILRTISSRDIIDIIVSHGSKIESFLENSGFPKLLT